MESLATLQRIRATQPGVPAPESELERAALARFTGFFSSLAPDRVTQLLDQVYAADVWFNDTLKTVRGREALGHYLRESAEAVEECRFEVEESTRAAPGEFLLRWKMMVRFRRFRRGQDTWSIGVSHLRFDAEGRVVYQQDYWNAADGLYRHLPLLGSLIGWVQRRL